MERPHVLIVDDDESIQLLLSEILTGDGYRVTTAGDGQDAWASILTDPPAVILTDLRMPRMDGRVLIEKALAAEPETMIVVLTGHGTVEEAVDLMRKGVFSILTKPLKADSLTFMVDKAYQEKVRRDKSRELERRLKMSERLAMIGKLAAGVAHELNNPLDGVTRFVKLAKDSTEEEADTQEFLDYALSGLQRMSTIVKDLLTFSRNIVLEVEEERIEHLLSEATRQVVSVRDTKEVEIKYDLAVTDVWVPRGMFQVFQNLLINAVDAIEESGTIRIQAGIRDGEVFVAVEDDGCGVPEDIRQRVFEPFFTTKPTGKGTGLGLSIVSRIMERFGGGVQLTSEVGHGTTVSVYLPKSSYTTRGVDNEGDHA